MTGSMTRIQESVESLHKHHLLAAGHRWSEQILERAEATEEFVQTGTTHLEHINSSVDTLFNQQLLEDKPTGVMLLHMYVCRLAMCVVLYARDDADETRFQLSEFSVLYKATH